MIEGAVAPIRGGMALIAGLRESGRHVIGIGCALEILQVALHTGAAGQVVVVVHVTLCARDRCVCPGQCKTGSGVIERRRRPVGRAMALLAGLRETRAHVVRVGGALEILQVAAHASRVRRRQVVVAVHMALHAL